MGKVKETEWRIEMIKTIFITILLICLYIPLSAQTFLGLHLEPITYLANVEKLQNNPTIKNKELSIEGNLGITFSLTFISAEKIGISLRPGITLGYIYFGYDAGLFWSFNFDEDKYVVGGINVHFNLPRAGSSSAQSERLLLPFLVVGGGYKVTKNFLTEVQFNLSLNNVNYGWVRDMQDKSPYLTTWNYYKVPWLIKISLAYSWNL